jgi:hypothetical protein
MVETGQATSRRRSVAILLALLLALPAPLVFAAGACCGLALSSASCCGGDCPRRHTPLDGSQCGTLRAEVALPTSSDAGGDVPLVALPIAASPWALRASAVSAAPTRAGPATVRLPAFLEFLTLRL